MDAEDGHFLMLLACGDSHLAVPARADTNAGSARSFHRLLRICQVWCRPLNMEDCKPQEVGHVAWAEHSKWQAAEPNFSHTYTITPEPELPKQRPQQIQVVPRRPGLEQRQAIAAFQHRHINIQEL